MNSLAHSFDLQNTRAHRGFSLIELLVAIAVIGILATITFSTITAVIERRNNTVCSVNLRSIGAAIQLHAADNSGLLPGPTWTKLSSNYHADDKTHLSSHLAKYLELSMKPDEGFARADIYTCPAHMDTLGFDYGEGGNLPMYALHLKNFPEEDEGGYKLEFPFGHIASKFSREPKNVNAIKNPAKSWAMRDFDPDGQVVHGTFRNYLYFDGHVESHEASYNPPRL